MTEGWHGARSLNRGWRPIALEVVCGYREQGPVYMVSVTRENTPYRGNFIERLHEKKLSLLGESKLTLLNYL